MLASCSLWSTRANLQPYSSSASQKWGKRGNLPKWAIRQLELRISIFCGSNSEFAPKVRNARVNNIRTELIIPAGVTLTTGSLVSEGVDLTPNAEATYQYGLTVDVPEVPT